VTGPHPERPQSVQPYSGPQHAAPPHASTSLRAPQHPAPNYPPPPPGFVPRFELIQPRAPRKELVPASPSRDRRLAIGGAATVMVSVLGVAAGQFKLFPSSAAAVVVLIAAGAGLRIAVLFFARSASSRSRARVTMLVSTAGLAVSAVVLVASLPVATRTGGMGHFASDLFAQLWTVALLTVAAAPVRTVGWRALVGVAFMGFLALPALARLIGRPVIDSLGDHSVVANSLWIPLTEELCQALPIILLVVFAARRTARRPSALDLMLVGAWTGAGFSLYENTQFGRGGADWSAAPPFSGHTVWIALLGLGLAFGVLYRRRFRFAWLAIPVSVAVALVEHGAVNALGLTTSGSQPALESLVVVLTLGGWLSSVLLVGGIAMVLRIEWRALKLGPPESPWRLVRPEVAQRRGQLLAAAQAIPVEPTIAIHADGVRA
jgi:RsiW-degrading membrane proteinase PrsW (M82 family)